MTARSFPSLPWMRELQRGKRDRPLFPAWQTGIQDTISWFVAGAHQWLLIPLKAGWSGIGMTPPARAHTHPAALSPSLYAAHYKHPFCFQYQILIPAPKLKNCKEWSNSPFYYWFRENESRRPFPPHPRSRKLQKPNPVKRERMGERKQGKEGRGEKQHMIEVNQHRKQLNEQEKSNKYLLIAIIVWRRHKWAIELCSNLRFIWS